MGVHSDAFNVTRLEYCISRRNAGKQNACARPRRAVMIDYRINCGDTQHYYTALTLFRTGLIVMKSLFFISVLFLMFLSKTFAATPAVGELAPDFRLQDSVGQWHTLSEYRGKWVALYFYPKDGTPGCTTEACEFRDNVFAFHNANAVIVGISVDDIDDHKKFAEKT